MTDNAASNVSASQGAYTVLARKYRPQTFEDLIGQEPMVRTLKNAFSTGRIAHAFILTGVRGVGKTTTARILARALNYSKVAGDDAGPTADLDEDGVHCKSIAESRHPDVFEMDAASRTGISDIRELIDGVRYAPVSARYKVYIVDEVHMLSTAAFNGLLKTLEEPPPHVKFIFATTEIRKVPITVLSRCQRFDLRRIEPDVLKDHLKKIVKHEDVGVEEAALILIARAAEGSVRDALSLLDQAITLGEPGTDVSQEAVKEMLGLADRLRTLDLMHHVFQGDASSALQEFQEQYAYGADPVQITRDMLEHVHNLTRLKAAGSATDFGGGEDEMRALRKMEDKLGVGALTRAWGMLLKGLGEVQTAPSPAAAFEMLIIRLAYASTLPTPDEALKALGGSAGASPRPGGATPPSGAGDGRPAGAAPQVLSFGDVAALAAERRDLTLKNELEAHVHLVAFAPGKIELRLNDSAKPDLPGRLAQKLYQWTGDRWLVSVNANAEAQPTLRDRRDAEVRSHPLVKAALETFPGAEVVAVRDLSLPSKEAEQDQEPFDQQSDQSENM